MSKVWIEQEKEVAELEAQIKRLHDALKEDNYEDSEINCIQNDLCFVCRGSGKMDYKPCYGCNGTGKGEER